MKRFGMVSMVAALVLSAGFSAVRADSFGTLGFADIGAPTADGSPSGDINTATQFTIGNLVTTAAYTGVFSGLDAQILGAVSFDTTVGTSLNFATDAFGSFSSTSITQIANTAGSVTFYVLGNLIGGTYTGDLTPNPAPASFTIAFTQTLANTGGISDSATLAIPAGVVPEPSSITMVGMGLAALGVVGARRKRMLAKA